MFALFDSTVKILDDVDADIVLASPARYALPAEKRIPLRTLAQAKGCAGVQAVVPVYLERFAATFGPLPSGKAYPIRVVAFPLDEQVFKRPFSPKQLETLRRPNTALIDSKSKRPNFDFALSENEKPSSETVTELTGRRLTLVGRFELGTDFANDGNLVMSSRNFARYFPWRGEGDPLSIVDLGLVRLASGTSSERVQQQLRETLGEQVLVLSAADYRKREINFWRKSTPIGMIFQMGVLLGFVVGVIICYQVIYNDVADHMPEFATLKAMGYSHWYFVRVVIGESILLSILGFLPGLLIASVVYYALGQATGLLMLITLQRTVFVFLLTLIMCIVSGIFALRKLLAADPADLF